MLRRVPGKVQGAMLGLAGLAGGGGASAWARRSTWTAAGKNAGRGVRDRASATGGLVLGNVLVNKLGL